MSLKDTAPMMAITTQVQAGVLPEVPHEKVWSMVLRTFVGGILLLVGLGLIAVEVVTLIKTHDKAQLSLWVFGAGLFLVILGPTVWSTQLVSQPFQVVLAMLRAVVDIVRGPKGA